MTDKSVKEYMIEWVNGDDLDSIRKDPHVLTDEIDENGVRYSLMYRYIEDEGSQRYMNLIHGNPIDPIYGCDIGDTIEYGLISTTILSPKEAYDDWFTPHTNVMVIHNVKGISTDDYDATKFKWENEVLTYGRFKLSDIKERRYRGIPYTEFTLRQI